MTLRRAGCPLALGLVGRLVCMGALLVSGLPERALAADPAPSLIVAPQEEDLLLLAVRLDRTILTNSLPAYQTPSGVLVPLGELCRLLDLGITVDPASGTAAGFFIDEGRRFALDVRNQSVVVAGRSKRFDSAQIEIHEDDIYADASLLSEWLPLGLVVDPFGAVITVHPEEKLPLQLRLERARQLEMSGASGSGLASLPRRELPYRLFDGPFIDQTLRFATQPISGGGRNNLAEYATYVTGDLLFMEASAFLSGSDQGVSDSRLSLGRKDPDGRLLGFLAAREVTVGDVFHPGLELIASPRSGPGVLISSFPLDRQIQFDRQSFRGDLPPGWEAELYRGDELLAYTQSRADGLYEFIDVPLLFGFNVFRVELYGPQGQRRSELHRFNVGDTLTPKGRVYYRLAANDPSYRLAGTGPTDNQSRASFDLSAGLTRNLSASLSLAAVDLINDGPHAYAKAALRAFWGLLFANLDVAADRNGGSVWQGTVQSRLGSVGVEAQHAVLDGFVSERFGPSFPSPLRSRTHLRFHAVIPSGWLPQVPVLFEARQDRFESGAQRRELTGSVSTFSRGLAVSNQVTWATTSGGDETPTTTATGQFLVSRHHRAFSVRGQLAYSIRPDLQLDRIAMTGDQQLESGLLASAGVSRAIETGRTRYLVGLSKLEGAFGLGVTVNYTSPGGFGASVLLSVSVGRDPRDGSWHHQARPLAGFGALSARAFLDANGNGRFDLGEEPIADAGFLLNGAGGLARTDPAGGAFLANLSPYQDVDLTLATSTLEDPFWKPAVDGVRILPRPGKVAVIDFPVLVTGEITGTVYLERGGTSREASGVDLELVDSRGTVVKTARTAYDGFYDITDVEPGSYTLRVTAEHVVKLAVVAPSREVDILPSGTVIDGLDFVLRPARSSGAGGEAATPAAPPVPTAARMATEDLQRPVPSPVAAVAEWGLQLESLRDPAAAEQEARRLAVELDRPTRVIRVDLGSLGSWSRVYVVGYRSAAEARRARVGLSSQGIVSLPPVELPPESPGAGE